MRKLLRDHPVLVWAIGAFLVYVLIDVGGVEYDDGKFGFLILTDGIWAWMYWLPNEMLFSLNNGRAVPYHITISVIVGLLIAVGVDAAIRGGRAWFQARQSR